MDIKDKQELVRLLELKKQYADDKVLENLVPSPIQELYLLCNRKIALLLGSNRCGKSHILAANALIRLLGVVPTCLKDKYPKEFFRPGECWISALDFTSTIEITQKKIHQLMPKHMLVKQNKEIKQLVFKTANQDLSSEIIFKSAESTWEKYRGTSKVLIQLDEEHPKNIYDECFMRTIDCGGILRLAYTPDKGMTWGYPELYQKAFQYTSTINVHGIREDVGIVHTLEEIALLKQRKVVTKLNPSSEANEDIEVFTMTIYDNPYLSDIEIRRTEEKWKDDIPMYYAKILGGFAKNSGRNVFPQEQLTKLQAKCPSTFWQGDIVNGQLKQHPKGRLVIFKDLKKVHENQYVIGADLAEGIDTGDFSCLQILSRNHEQWGIWHGRCSLDELGVILYDVGMFFNHALLVPEINFQGYAIINALKGKYLNIYSEYDVIQDTINVSSNRTRKRYGWRTDVKTKPIMIRDLLVAIKTGHLKLNDINTIEELLTYTYLKDGSMGAMGGCFDDRVMGMALALQGLKKPYRPIPQSKIPMKRNQMGYEDTN